MSAFGEQDDRLARRLQKQGVLQTIFHIVLHAFPQEGCGFVLETSAGQLKVVEARNLSAPGDALRRFEADMTPWLVAEMAGEKPLVAFHSHTDGNAEMSKLDMRLALFKDAATGELLERHPGLAHVVVTIDGKTSRVRLARMFRFSKTQGCFVCVATFSCT